MVRVAIPFFAQSSDLKSDFLEVKVITKVYWVHLLEVGASYMFLCALTFPFNHLSFRWKKIILKFVVGGNQHFSF